MTRSKIITGLVVASAMFAGVAFAGNIDGSIGNTVVMSYPDGSKMEFRNAADGTTKVTLPDGTVEGAKWKLEGDKLTYTADKDGKTYVYDVTGPGMKVGDKMAGKDSDGKDVTYEVVAGQ